MASWSMPELRATEHPTPYLSLSQKDHPFHRRIFYYRLSTISKVEEHEKNFVRVSVRSNTF